MRLLKLDSIHPIEYLQHKQQEWKSMLFEWSRKEYLEKIISLRCNFSDFYTHNLNLNGWHSEEYFMNDWVFTLKTARELYGTKYYYRLLKHRLRDRLGLVEREWRLKVLADYIDVFRPDVIFCREHTNIPADFWNCYRNKIFLVSRLSAHIPQNWTPLQFDLIYTDLQHYRDFFVFNKVETLYNYHGFDTRINDEVSKSDVQYSVVFIGGLGNDLFDQRTKFFADLASDQQIGFYWWGYYSGRIDDKLVDCYQGLAAGLDMFNIYHNSKIVVNDYVDIAAGTAVNQRIFEVMGVGAMLLTRESPNLHEYFPPGSFVTYTNADDCKEKIKYYQKHEEERQKIANAGQSVVLKNYNYSLLMKNMSKELQERVVKHLFIT